MEDVPSERSGPLVVEQTNDFDVILGRGRRTSRCPGNVYFRAYIAERAPMYDTCGSIRHKDLIARQSVEHIHSKGGRFLRPVTATNKKTGDAVAMWEVANEDAIIMKVKQALRDAVAITRCRTEREAQELECSAGTMESTSARVNHTGSDRTSTSSQLPQRLQDSDCLLATHQALHYNNTNVRPFAHMAEPSSSIDPRLTLSTSPPLNFPQQQLPTENWLHFLPRPTVSGVPGPPHDHLSSQQQETMGTIIQAAMLQRQSTLNAARQQQHQQLLDYAYPMDTMAALPLRNPQQQYQHQQQHTSTADSLSLPTGSDELSTLMRQVAAANHPTAASLQWPSAAAAIRGEAMHQHGAGIGRTPPSQVTQALQHAVAAGRSDSSAYAPAAETFPLLAQFTAPNTHAHPAFAAVSADTTAARPSPTRKSKKRKRRKKEQDQKQAALDDVNFAIQQQQQQHIAAGASPTADRSPFHLYASRPPPVTAATTAAGATSTAILLENLLSQQRQQQLLQQQQQQVNAGLMHQLLVRQQAQQQAASSLSSLRLIPQRQQRYSQIDSYHATSSSTSSCSSS